MEEVAKVVRDAFPQIHVNEVAVWKYMLDKSGHMINKLMESILSAPSVDIVDHMIATMVVFCHNLPANYKQSWFQATFARVPNNILTEEEKVNQLNDIIKYAKKKDILRENIEIIARRARNVIGRGK